MLDVCSKKARNLVQDINRRGPASTKFSIPSLNFNFVEPGNPDGLIDTLIVINLVSGRRHDT